MARPLRWQRSSGASALMNFGRHSGRKLALSLTVARQENSVLTKTGARTPSISAMPMSWMSVRPVTRPSRGTNLRCAPCGVVAPAASTFSNRHSM